MSHSVRLLTRLGIAIEKLGQHVSQIGSGRRVHAQPSGNVGSRRPVTVNDYRGKPEAKNTVDFGSLGNAVDKDGLSVVRNNVEGGFSNGDLPKAAGHASPQYQSLMGAQQGNWNQLLSSPPVSKNEVLRAREVLQEAEKRYRAFEMFNQPHEPREAAEAFIALHRAKADLDHARAEYGRVFALWGRFGYPE